mgnify:CR=1 FL=1
MRENLQTFPQATVILVALGIIAEVQPSVVTEIPDPAFNLTEAGNFVYLLSGGFLLRTTAIESDTIHLRSCFSDVCVELTQLNKKSFPEQLKE